MPKGQGELIILFYTFSCGPVEYLAGKHTDISLRSSKKDNFLQGLQGVHSQKAVNGDESFTFAYEGEKNTFINTGAEHIDINRFTIYIYFSKLSVFRCKCVSLLMTFTISIIGVCNEWV